MGQTGSLLAEWLGIVEIQWSRRTRGGSNKVCPALDVNDPHVVRLLEAMVRRHGGCLRVVQYRRRRNSRGKNLFTSNIVTLAELGQHQNRGVHDSITRCNLCLGKGVAFLGSYETEGICLTPKNTHGEAIRGVWEARTIPVHQDKIKRLVELFVETVRRCRQFRPRGSDNAIVSRVMVAPGRCSEEEDETDDDEHADTPDLKFSEPENWGWGLHSAQLSLLMLKVCAHENVLEIRDAAARGRLMRCNSHACQPEDLDRLITECWPAATRESADAPRRRKSGSIFSFFGGD